MPERIMVSLWNPERTELTEERLTYTHVSEAGFIELVAVNIGGLTGSPLESRLDRHWALIS